MATHSSILAWEILWMEEPDSLLSTGLHRVGHNWVTNTHKWRLDYLSSETLILNQEQSQTCVYQLCDFSLHNMPLHGLETEFWQNKWSRVHLKKRENRRLCIQQKSSANLSCQILNYQFPGWYTVAISFTLLKVTLSGWQWKKDNKYQYCRKSHVQALW